MASDRDTLADLINDDINRQVQAHVSYISHLDQHELADAVIAAGWHPPAQVIETMQALDTLPVGAIIRTEQGRAAVKESQYEAPDTQGNYSEWSVAEGYDGALCGSDALDDLPALVVWSPTEKASE